MEYDSAKKASEKDSRMVSSFESYFDSNESDEDPKKKKKRVERGEQSEKQSEETAEKKKPESLDDKEKQDTTEKKDDLSLLHEEKEEAEDELDLSAIEDEPELPENPEEISDDEMRVIASQLLDAHEAQLHEELAETEEDSPEEAAVLAKAMLVEDLQESVGKEPPDEAVLANTVDRVADELDISPEPEAESDEAVAEAEDMLEQATSRAETEIVEDLEAETPESGEVVDDGGEDDTSVMTNVTQSPGTAASGASPVSGTVPPTVPPIIAAGGVGGSDLGPLPGGANGSPNSMPASPNIAQSPSEISGETRYRRGADMLVGGIVGYLIGRRRGRIKTEQRLEPIQKSLEKKVTDFQEKLIISEEKVGKLASDKIAREGEAARKVIAERVEAKARAKFEAKQAAKDAAKQEARASAPELESPPAPAEAQKTPEAVLDKRRPERVASVLLPKPELTVHEKHKFTTPENREPTTYAAKEAVQKMPENELLAIAAKVEIGGQTAKVLYEQGRVSKEDLREIAVEQIRGTGKAERLLVERLRPVRSSETGERLQPEMGSGDQGTPGGGASPVPVMRPVQSTPTNQKQTDISAASDALIAEQAAEDRKESSHVVAWTVVVGAAALLVAALFVF